MDYLREGRAAEEIARNLARDAALWSHLRVPRIHWDLTTRRVLAMEFIDGVKINDADGVARQGVSREDLVAWASRAFLHMMFRDGFFHCDPHPGNLIVDAQRADRDHRLRHERAPRARRARRGARSPARRRCCATASCSRARSSRPARSTRATSAVAREIAELAFDPALYNLTPQEVAGLDFSQHFWRLRGQMVRLRSFRLPPGVVMWSRAISILYGLVVELAPGIRPLDAVRAVRDGVLWPRRAAASVYAPPRMTISAEDFKRALSRRASGVAVVTARNGERIHGMTVSAFTEVSLEPPLVLVCADKSSNTLPVIRAGGVFAINVLARDQQELSNRFALKKDEDKRFDGLEFDVGAHRRAAPARRRRRTSTAAWSRSTTRATT